MERINFIERELFFLTYRKMAIWGGVALSFLFLFHGAQSLQTLFVEKRIAKVIQEVEQLKDQQRRVLEEAQEKKGENLEGRGAIRSILEKAPRWSLVLKKLGEKMPSGVWLISLKSYPKEDPFIERGLLLSGEAEEVGEISNFLEGLETSREFEGAVLTESKQESRGSGNIYIFTIDSIISKMTGDRS